MAEKVIKGQALLVNNQIIQSQTIFRTDGSIINSDAVLLNDVMKDLTSQSHTYKSKSAAGGKKFFYWEYEMTDLEDNDVKVYLECPKPTFSDDLTSGKGEWVDYWKAELKTIQDRYQAQATIQPETHHLAGTKYVAYDGTNREVTIEDKDVTTGNLSDIQNLLWMF